MQKLSVHEHVHLTGNILKAFTKNRIITLIDFLQEDVLKLSSLSKLSLPQILEIRNNILSKYSAPLVNGTNLFDNISYKQFYSTGISSLDKILYSGIPIGFITEICGLAGCGKSQLCMQLAINLAHTMKSVILYIDTKGDFSAVRIQKILDSLNFSHKDMALIMVKVKIVHIWHMEDLLKLFEELQSGALTIEHLSLVIIDSLPSLMFQYFGDDNKIGLKFLNCFVNIARQVSKKMEVGIVCVNIQTRWIDAEGFDLEDECGAGEPSYTETFNRCLGKYWKNIPLVILYLEKSGNNINVTVVKDTYPQGYKSCTLEVGACGVGEIIKKLS